MLFLPGDEIIGRDLIDRVRGTRRRNVDDDGVADEPIDRDLVGGLPCRGKMPGCVEVRPPMLGRRETIGSIVIALGSRAVGPRVELKTVFGS